MRNIVVALALSAFFPIHASPLSAQEVELTLPDDQSVRGSLEGFQGGKYRIRVEGKLRVISEDDVITLTILDRRTRPTSGLEEIEAAFGEGRTSDAMRAIHRMLDRIPFKNRELRMLALEQHREGISRLITGRNGKELRELTLAALEVFSTEEEGSLLQDLQREVRRRRTETGDDSFLLELAETLALLVHRMSVLSASAQASLPPLLEETAETARKKENRSAAWKLLRALVRVDASRGPALRELRLKLALEDARQKQVAGDVAGAIAATDEVLQLHPNHPSAFEIREEILFDKLQADLNRGGSASDRENMVHEFLRVAQKRENREWATAQLKAETSTQSLGAVVFEQMRKYYPVRPGATWRYRTGEPDAESREEEVFQVIRIRDVTETENGRRITGVVETEQGNSSVTRPFRVRVDGDSIFLSHTEGALLKFPLQRGSWWEWGGTLSGTGTQKHIRKVTSDSRTVTTPHGTFHNCIEITFSTELTRGGKSRRLESKEIYAPAFGLVKVEYLDPEFRRHNLELVEYRDR